MKATLRSGDLRRAVELAARAVEVRNTRPILDCVRLDFRHDGTGPFVAVTGTNEEVSLRATARCGNADTFTVCVPARVLARILRGIRADDFVAVSTHDGLFRVDCADARFSLIALDAKDFPPEIDENWEATGSLTLPPDWPDVLDRLRAFVCLESFRYYLYGVCLHRQGEALVNVATDGHRLGKFAVPAEGLDALGTRRIILPYPAMALLAGVPRGTDAIRLDLLGKTFVGMRVSIGSVVVTAKLIDHDYVEYERVLPKSDRPAQLWTAPRATLLAKLRRLVPLAGRQSGAPVEIVAEATRIVGSLRHVDYGGASIALPGQCSEVGPLTAVNLRYLVDVLSSLTADEVSIALTGPGDPIALTTVASELVVLMPMRSYFDRPVDLPEAVAA